MVRVIRTFRPLVIYSRFSGTPHDGHGQHQMAGYLTPLAFKAAADPGAVSRAARRGVAAVAGEEALSRRRLPPRSGERADDQRRRPASWTGALGRTYAEIAAEGRSQHKSQEMGGIEPLGPAASGPDPAVEAPSAAPAAAGERSIFDGLDVSVAGLGDGRGPARRIARSPSSRRSPTPRGRR